MLQFKLRAEVSGRPVGQLPPAISAILRARGIDSEEKAERFLRPRLEHLYDPLLMQGMDRAVAIIREAAAQKTPTVVYGDYDCDGVCAASILLETLRDFGADVEVYIPDRHAEGYGLNREAVQALAAEGKKLLITVDCGITNHGEVQLAQTLGMTVIVTDHHEPAPTPSPADVTLNPLLGSYPFRRLCGAGVALKLTQALLGMDAVKKRLDLAALATVADLVPLADENRVIVRLGLEAIGATARPGLRALMTLADVKLPVTSGAVSFRLAPRINTGGRLAKARPCVDLLTPRDADEANRIAVELNEMNGTRQTMQTQITQAAEDAMRTDVDFYSDRAIVVMGEGWESGVIGLAAGRICERYHFPTIVLSRGDEYAVGSCRSIDGVDIHRALVDCDEGWKTLHGEPLFLRYGGHTAAAGLTLRPERLPDFKRLLNTAIDEQTRDNPRCFLPTVEYDWDARLQDMDMNLAEALGMIEPTGFGNPAPVFLTRGADVQFMKQIGRDLSHLRTALYEGDTVRYCVGFGMGHLASRGLGKVDALYVPEVNEFNGQRSVQLQLKALEPAEGSVSFPPDDVIFRALLQEIAHIASNDIQITDAAAAPSEGEALPDVRKAQLRAMTASGHGTLIIGHEARRLADVSAGLLADRALGRVEDVRAFSTVLLCPDLGSLRDTWHDIVLADGEALPGEAEAIRAACPRARLWRMAENPVLTEQLRALAMPKEALRALYVALRAIPGAALSAIAGAAAMTEAQALTAMRVLSEIGLIACEEAPWQWRMLPVKKIGPESSPLWRYLQRLGAAASGSAPDAGCS